jgi:PPM family protein phosphatase
MHIEVAGKTHVGMRRNHNEDNYLVLAEQSLFVVADGMGGHQAGEIASKIAIDEMLDFYKRTGADQDATWPFKMDRAKSYDENRLLTAIKLANLRIFELQASDAKYKGMGTTIVSLHFTPNTAFIGHVGDSRVYFQRGGTLKQITEDHSLLTEYAKSKKMTPEEIAQFQYRNVILRALGMREVVEVDINRVASEDGDTFLLCSDGLSGMVPDPQIQECLSKSDSLEGACDKLIDMANAAGGTDNITCVLARYHA